MEYPTPRTVWISFGSAASTFFRRLLTKDSTIVDSPLKSYCHTESRI